MTAARYPDWPAVAQAMKAAATKRSAAGGSSLTLGDQLLQARFDRFLSRVFAEGDRSGWLLKGGTGLLARVPEARRTQDVDLAASVAGLDAAVEDLRRRVDVDLGDHLRFVLASTKATGLGQTQPAVETRQVVFSCWAGAKKVGDVKVDIVVGPPPTGRVDVLDPSGRLELARGLPTHPYRLFPLVDQVAEKVCATMSTAYAGGMASSRVKDLVDLVVIARTQTLELRPLQLAIATQRALSRIAPFDRLEIPAGWERPYRALAASTPPAAGTPDAAAASSLMDAFLTPALAIERAPEDLEWMDGRCWGASGERVPESQSEAEFEGGDVWVQPHVRDGKPIAGHWRSARGSGRA